MASGVAATARRPPHTPGFSSGSGSCPRRLGSELCPGHHLHLPTSVQATPQPPSPPVCCHIRWCQAHHWSTLNVCSTRAMEHLLCAQAQHTHVVRAHMARGSADCPAAQIRALRGTAAVAVAGSHLGPAGPASPPTLRWGLCSEG